MSIKMHILGQKINSISLALSQKNKIEKWPLITSIQCSPNLSPRFCKCDPDKAVCWLALTGPTVAQLGAFFSFDYLLVKSCFLCFIILIKLILLFPCDDTLYKLGSLHPSLTLLCINKSRIYGGDLASEI